MNTAMAYLLISAIFFSQAFGERANIVFGIIYGAASVFLMVIES